MRSLSEILHIGRPRQYNKNFIFPRQQAAIKERDSHQSALRVSKLIKALKYFKVRSHSQGRFLLFWFRFASRFKAPSATMVCLGGCQCTTHHPSPSSPTISPTCSSYFKCVFESTLTLSYWLISWHDTKRFYLILILIKRNLFVSGFFINPDHHPTETDWKKVRHLRDDGFHNQSGQKLSLMSRVLLFNVYSIRLHRKVGLLQWYPPLWRQTTQKLRFNQALTFWGQSSRSSFRFDYFISNLQPIRNTF